MQIDFFQVFDDMVKEEAAAALEAAKQAQAQNSPAQVPKDPEPVPVLDPEPEPDPVPVPAAAPQGDPAVAQQPPQG